MKKNSEYNEPKKSILQADRTTLNLAHLKRDIARMKAKLSKKKAPLGENFGETEVRKLVDTYMELTSDYWADESNEARKAISDFEEWTQSYEPEID